MWLSFDTSKSTLRSSALFSLRLTLRRWLHYLTHQIESSARVINVIHHYVWETKRSEEESKKRKKMADSSFWMGGALIKSETDYVYHCSQIF